VRLDQLGNVIDSVEKQQSRGLVQRDARRDPCGPAAARHQHGRRGGQHQALLPALRAEIPPSVELSIAFDASRSIRGSIQDVEFTLLLTVGLVVMVIFLFLEI